MEYIHVLIFFVIYTGSLVSCQPCYRPGYTGPFCNKYNLAYKKTAHQKESYVTHSARLAVDDNQESCTVVEPPVQNPTWQVDLGKDMIIDGVFILMDAATQAQIQTYTVEVKADNADTVKMCKAFTGQITGNPFDVRCQTPLQGRHVIFTVMHQSLNMSFCDVGVYGRCVDMSYGNYCEETCGHCKSSSPVCDKVTGRCPTGCDVGYFNDTCKDPCPSGKYGDQCALNCGHCYLNVTCNRFTGDCPDLGVCEPGYQSPKCQAQCPSGTFGKGCIECGNCTQPGCDTFTGQCDLTCTEYFNNTCVSSPCLPGYKATDATCFTVCDDGWYGDSCFNECGHCAGNGTSTGPCNKITGMCEFGCAPGYVEDSKTASSSNQCRNVCPDGKWGLNCQETCGHCEYEFMNGTRVDAPCKTSDGSCLRCKIGWQGSLCKDPCTPGTYGYDCSKVCGKCRDLTQCNRITGECEGNCADGYIGKYCNQVCPSGFYGFNCSMACPENCAGGCSHTDASCTCKDGWTGPKCTEVCPENHYGRNCDHVCGHCKPGTTCWQVNGYCKAGCDEEWDGPKCDARIILEEYKRSYADVIGGTIGGVIALALISVFVAWVVWRYRKDKSIHIRELAASLRRMSLRGSKTLRRSFQRLSMRLKRGNNDQQNLDKNAETPATSNGTRGHKSTAKIPRMYENIRVQSNTIHYDDFSRLYLQLQEAKSDGKTLLYDSFQSFLAQRPQDTEIHENGSATNAFYNTALDDIQVHVGSENDGEIKIPEFLPLGTNLSGFLLINGTAASTSLWNHLQQRQIETVISIGKEASFSWRPGERITIGPDVVECIDVQLHSSHKETKLTVQRQGVRGRRGVRHLECFFWNKGEKFPLIPNLLMFMERFQQINYAQRERIILVNYINSHDQAILFTLVASMLEILNESKRADILRTVATGGKATAKAVRSFAEFKFLHDVIFQYIRSIENNASSTAI